MRAGTCKRVDTPSGRRKLCKSPSGRVRFVRDTGGSGTRGLSGGGGRRAKKRECAKYGRNKLGNRTCRSYRKARR